MSSRKRGSSVAACCGTKPLVVVTYKGEFLEHVFVVDDVEELLSDKRFWEVMYQDEGCPDLGLKKVKASDEIKRFACLLALALELLS